jgi:hypothetical protein
VGGVAEEELVAMSLVGIPIAILGPGHMAPIYPRDGGIPYLKRILEE